PTKIFSPTTKESKATSAFPVWKETPPFHLVRVRRFPLAHSRRWAVWWPAPNAIATRAYGPLRPCTQRATCMWGCVEGAKASVDLTHWPQNIKAGVKLITGARVRRLEINSAGLVTGAEYVDRDGAEHFQRAGLTVLGASGIGTPRILL